MPIYVTGDTHGDMNRFSFERWPESRNLTENDVMIIAGDFGLIWDNVPSNHEKYWRQWLTTKKWTFAFVEGNHENHPRLADLPKIPMYGGTVGVVEKNIINLRRGEIYEIQDKKIFTFGGADSIDKGMRRLGISWWPEELPTNEQIEYALSNLERHQYAVDIIIAHTAPQDIAEIFFKKYGTLTYNPDPTRKFLQHICSETKFDEFYCGHWHEEYENGKYHFLSENIVKIA